MNDHPMNFSQLIPQQPAHKENYIPNLEKSHNLGYLEKINLNDQIKNSINLALRHNRK